MAVKKRPAPPPKPRRREAPCVRRAQILSAARTRFANAGFKATTVDDIAAEAGVSVGLLYRLFASKSAIVEAIILEQVEEQVAEAFEIISASPESGIDRARAIKSFGDASLDLQKLALMFEMTAEACRNQPLREFMQGRRAELYATLVKRLTDSGMERKTAERMFAELDIVGAIGSAAIIQSLTNAKMSVAQNIKGIFRSIENSSRKRSDE